MKFTFSWLKEFLDTSCTVDDITEKLNQIGLEVDHVTRLDTALNEFKVAEIISVTPHPNADRLKICQVNTGTETVQVVCGAPNARAGLRTVLANPGAYIPGLDLIIKSSTIRDVVSEGMLCSAIELNLGTNNDGIIEVSNTYNVGQPYVQQAHLDDPLIEIELTPNRGDCTGIYGIARDLAAAGCGTLNPLKNDVVDGQFSSTINIDIQLGAQDINACSYFTGRTIRNVKNQISPRWLQDRLTSIGSKTISSLVDITNFMTYHLGRPMHVFDADKIQGNIIIRKAKNGETLHALDDKIYVLNTSTTVVADDHSVLAIAGIIGGKKTSCTLETTNIFLESAYFDPIHTARTGQQLKIITDSRYRFERGVDPALVRQGLEYASCLIQDICGGEFSYVVSAGHYQPSLNRITFNPARVQQLGSMVIDPLIMQKILSDLGFKLTVDRDEWQIEVPSWRHDINHDADIVEEIMRIVGYDAIITVPLPSVAPLNSHHEINQNVKQLNFINRTRAGLAGLGFQECQTWSFISNHDASLFDTVELSLVIDNPISQEMAVMRPNLLVNLIKGIGQNDARGHKGAKLFEIGNRFDTNLNFDQEKTVAWVRGQCYQDQHWIEQKRDTDFYDLKADVLTVLQAMNINADKVQWTTQSIPSYFHPGHSACLQIGPKNTLAYVGQLHPHILAQLSIQQDVFGAELYLERCYKLQSKDKYSIFIKNDLQAVIRDFAFIVEDSLSGAQIVSAIKKVNAQLIKDVKIFDVYQGQEIEPLHKSVALSVTLQPNDKSFTDQQLKDISSAIVITIQQNLKGKMRS